MTTGDPDRITCSRWPYAMLALAVGLLVITMAMALMVGRNLDWTFFASTVPIEIGLVICLVSLTLKTMYPPTLAIGSRGLTLRKGLKERTWQWRQINTFYSQSLPKGGSMVGFRWEDDPGAPLRGTWLNYPFPGGAEPIVRRLTDALAVARDLGTKAPNPATPPDPRKIWRWILRLNISLAVLIALVLAFIADANIARTALLTPVSPLLLAVLEVFGGAIGVAGIVSMIGLQCANTERPSPTSASIVLVLLVGTSLVLIGTALGGHAAWRIGDLVPFVGSRAPIVLKHYRIVNFGRTKGAAYAEIEPYPAAGRTSIAVSRDDYARLVAADRPDEASIYCYPVMTQTAGSAVRMLKPSVVRRHERRIAACPSPTDDRWRTDS